MSSGRVEVGDGELRDLVELGRSGRATDQRVLRRGGAQRGAAHAQQAQGDALHGTVAHRARPRPRRPPGRSRRCDARPRRTRTRNDLPIREVDGDEELVVAHTGRPRALEELRRGNATRRHRPMRPRARHSSASATAGSSDAGSACAIEPPMVPRLRICVWPMNGTARARSGAAAATVASRSTARWRVIAPMVRRAVRALDTGELVDPVQVDQVLEPGQAQCEHRHEALPTREHLALVGVLGEQPERLRDRRRRVVLERRRLHDGAPYSARRAI